MYAATTGLEQPSGLLHSLTLMEFLSEMEQPREIGPADFYLIVTFCALPVPIDVLFEDTVRSESPPELSGMWNSVESFLKV